jgi:sarcosine oxidase subunit gamma
MADLPLGVSPLARKTLAPRANGQAGVALAGGAMAGVAISEHAFTGKLILRGDATDAAFLESAQGALGFSLPLAPNTASGADGTAALWLGPNEWLIATPPGAAMSAAVSLKVALSGRHTAVTDTSDARTVIRLSGPKARDVLVKGCAIDLHPRHFGPGRVAQSMIARAGVILHQVDDAPSYDIYVVASFSSYLWDWLVDAAAEFGATAGS